MGTVMRQIERNLAKAVVMLAALLAAIPAAAAQVRDKATVSARYDPSGDPLIITLKADPEVAYLTQDVHLTGGTVGVGSKSVTLTITPPFNAGEKPKPTVLNVPLDADGDFNGVFKDTVRGGTYTAVATAPDGRGVARTVFNIYAADDLKTEAPAVVTSIWQNANTILDIVSVKVEALPPSPAKDKFRDKVKKLRAKVGEPMPPMNQIPTVIIVGTPQNIPKLVGPIDQGKKLATRSAEEIKRLNAKQTTCDDLEVITEGLKWVSFMWNFLSKNILETSANLATEALGVLSSKMAVKAGAPSEISFLVGEATRQNQSIIARKVSINNALGELTNLLAADAEILMNAYCQVFTGPVTGTMKASFSDINSGSEWWNYNYKVIGRLVLHYPKNATGARVGLKGHIEGYGYDFHVWENALSVLYPKLTASAVQLKRLFPPFDMGNELSTALTDYDEGSVAGILAPNSFFIAVDGEVTKDEMSIRLGPARTDFDAKARVLAITLSPLTLSLLPTAYELPYKDAHFLIERAFEGDVVVLPLKTAGDTMSAERQFKAQRGGLEASGEYTLNIKTCNPGCSQPSPKANKAAH